MNYIKKFFNNKKIQTRKCSALNDAVFCSTSPYMFDQRTTKNFDKIRQIGFNVNALSSPSVFVLVRDNDVHFFMNYISL